MQKWIAAIVLLLTGTLAMAQGGGSSALTANSSVDQILDSLHAVGQGLKDFAANVAMAEADALTGDTTTLLGTVRFQNKGPGDGRLRVVFDTRKIGEQTDKNAKTEYLLDNGWLIERDYKRKMQIDRQVLKPGQKMNLLKLGEGPFPLPIGQARADVLRMFEVKKVEPKQGDLPGTVHVQLTPIRETNQSFARQFKTIDVWVDTQTSFPKRIEVENIREKTIRTTDLSNVRTNAGLGDKDFALEKVQGWTQRSESLEE